MCNSSWSKVLRTGLILGSFALVDAATVAIAQNGSSVNFVDGGGATATSGTGWRTNPLRAGSASPAESSNALRTAQAAPPHVDPNVQPAAHSRGVQLRSRSEQTGIFSGWFGESPAPQSNSQPRPVTTATTQPRSNLMPPTSAAKQAMNMMPKFMSSSGKKNAASHPPVNSTPARAGSSSQTPANLQARVPATRSVPVQRPLPGKKSLQQSSFNTAASAQAYRQPTNSLPPTRLNSNPRPATRSAPASVKPQASSASAQVLIDAHQRAETAHTEADFSQVLALCQKVPANQATDEEAQFGRQLAAWALNRRGQLRARAGDDQAAIDDFKQAIRIDATCWRALHNRGVLLAQAGQFEPAFDDFHQTIELNPQFAKAYSNRAALYVLAGELEPALADYRRAIELDADLAVAHRGAGRTCHMLGRMDEALDYLTTAIELAPKDATALSSRADLLTDMGKYAAAAKDYERALAANSKSPDACRGSAWLLATCPDRAVRNPELALQRAQQALELQRKADAVTLDTLPAAQAGAGDFQSATATIRRAIELAPPSERSVYQDRLQMYRQSQPYRIAPLSGVEQAGYEQ